MLLIYLICFVSLSCFKAEGCSVPVFRYALERWPADPYLITIFHKGKLNEEQKKVITYYQKFYDRYEAVILSVFDLDDKKLSKKAREYWKINKQDSLPVVIVQYPYITRIEQLAGVYPLDMKSAKQLMESPTGRELARRILKNDTSVFMQIDGDDESENIKSEKIVKDALKKMEEDMKLPHEELADGEVLDEESMPYDEDSLKIKFSFLRVSRNSPVDKAFVDILLNSEPGLKEIKGPIVFPVYGRARALFAFSEEGINAENMAEAGNFLVGECSCEVKAQNPGIDLLVPIDWDSFIHYEINLDDALPPLTGLTSTIVEEKKLEEAPVSEIDLKKLSEVEHKTEKSPLVLNLVISLVGLVVLFAIVAIAIKNAGKKRDRD
jgi:hypothetical protein